MKVEEFVKKDGSSGKSYKPEVGDEIVAVASTTYKSNPRPVIIDKGTDKERAVNIISRGITALWEGNEVFVTLTEGQTKVLDKIADLNGKTIAFEEYESPKWGKLVGARVKKDEASPAVVA